MRKFRAFYGVLTEMACWLVSRQVTHVAMEATGICTMPVDHALIEQGRCAQVLVCNAAHVKNVPGRKTDVRDARHLARLLHLGEIVAVTVASVEQEAARDLVRAREDVRGI